MKQIKVCDESKRYWVAPHAGAWIETARRQAVLLPGAVAPHAGAWIETWLCLSLWLWFSCRAPRGRVD